MGRLRPLNALVAAAVLALATTTSGGPAAAAGPTLRYLAGPAGTLDPAFINSAADVQLLLQLYAGLTRLDETGEPYPSLAEGWIVSADDLTYTFRIRDGLRFSDGSPIDARDFRRSWLRLLDPETGATAPDVLSVVAGASERFTGRADEADVGIEAPDARTLIVRLRHPASYFPAIAATPATFVVPPAANGTAEWQTPDAFTGSGPYVVAGTDGPDLVLRANPEYVAGPPPIEEIRWMAGIDGDSVTAFSDGEVDLTPIGGADATWIAYDAELGLRLHRAEPLTVSYLGFDTRRPPFDDARVRRAFALALDRERLVPLYEGDASQAGSSIVPPALWPDGFSPAAEADADEARRLLDAAGYADRAGIGTITVNGTSLGGTDPVVATWREELGVDVAVEIMDFGDYLAHLDGDVPQVFSVTWIADYRSPHAIYGLLLEPGAQSNYGEWDDDRFVELLEAAAASEDDASRGRAYQAVDDHVAEEAPVIPWSYGDSWWLVADGLRGLGNLTIGLLDFGRVSWDG